MDSKDSTFETVIKLFEKQVDRGPDRVAVVANGLSLTYSQLDSQSNRLARYIRSVVPEGDTKIISILMKQSVEFMVCLWAILKSGHAFLAIDPDLPERRQAFMLRDTGSPLILSKKRFIKGLNRLQWECPELVRFLCLDSRDVHHEREEANNPLMEKGLWDLVGHRADDPIGRGGWQNSFTGELFTEQEVVECAENVFQKLKPYLTESTRILEIGCSSGMTMFRIAPHVGFYYGTDLSDVILDETRRQADRDGHLNIRLSAVAAHDIDTIDERHFDILLINSVVQAFHGHNYFRQVIEKALSKLNSKALIFVGDVMNQEQKTELEAALAHHYRQNTGVQATIPTDLTNELFLSPAFFNDLVFEQPGFMNCHISKKIGTVRNELTDYRFDALFEVDKSLKLPDRSSKSKHQDGQKELEIHTFEPLPNCTSEGDLAYIIYTSGSTGQPKGVMVEHRSLERLAKWYVESNSVTPDDRIARFANPGFDASIMETLPPLTGGASVWILGPRERLDLKLLNSFLEKNRITICFLPTALAEQFMKLDNSSLRRLHVGGEKLCHFKPNQYSVVNHYGPAECTVVASTFVVEGQESEIPIGKPLPGVHIHLLDEQGREVSNGTPGEMYISGYCVARGYLNLPEQTSKRFLTDLIEPGLRTYRTGDIGRRRFDGNLEYAGRVDHQVKIRGCRVELGEIESVLREHPVVREVVVEPVDESNLTAYIVTVHKTEAKELRDHCLSRLPEHMRPSAFCFIDKMPLTTHGKIDRRALVSTQSSGLTNFADPFLSSQVERQLLQIWRQVLGTQDVSAGDNFFSLGGNSLKVLKAVVEINKVFHVDTSATDLFDASTIPAQAALITSAQNQRFVPITKAQARQAYRASPSQKRLFMIHEIDDLSIAYNVPFAFTIRGVLDSERLSEAFQAVIAKHEILRTDFHLEDNTIVQRIHENLDFTVEFEDLSSRDFDLQAFAKDFVRPFDLGQVPLLRAQIIKRNPTDWLLLVDIHHILLDGTSAELIWRDLARAYSRADLEPPRIQYKDYSQWLRSEAVRKTLKEHESYWLSQFEGDVPALSLPTVFERPPIQSFDGQMYRFTIGEDTSGSLKKICFRYDLSLNMLLVAAYSILLSKYCGQDVVVIGTPVYGRNHADLTDVVGMFVRTLALRILPRQDQKVGDFLAHVRHVMLDALEHQEYPFEDLVARLDLPRDVSRNPLFDTMFVTQAFDPNPLQLAGLDVASQDPGVTTSRFDLTWYATPEGSTVTVDIEYCTALFTEPTIRAMSEHFAVLLDAICKDQSQHLQQIPMISPSERDRLLTEFNRTASFPELETSVLAGFKKVVQENPKDIALISQGRRLTYAELDVRSGQIGAFLFDQGTQPGEAVGIAAERSFETIAAMLGIIKAGAAILPLGPSHPSSYIEQILNDSEVRIVLGRLPMAKNGRIGEARVVQYNDFDGAVLEETDWPRRKPSDLLYIVYTSGTTGTPKGISVDDQTLINLIEYQRQFTDIDCSRVLQFAAQTFDVSFQEIFSCLLAGGTLQLISESDRTDPVKLFSLVEGEGIKTLFLPPAMLQVLFGEPEYSSLFPDCVRHIVAAGEQLIIPRRLRELIRGRKVVLHNHYGPSETHVVTVHRIDHKTLGSDRPPIGRPVTNRSVYILDRNDQLLPPGIPGELCIGGKLTRPCYLNRSGLTEQKFQTDPFNDGQQMYRTGDMAVWNRDGTIEFVGRIDNQVKVRGHRIEPSAIEDVVINFSGVRSAVVVPIRDTSSLHLCAYYVSDGEIQNGELRAYVSANLPEYMVPSFFVHLDEFPLTTNGKIDVSALPSPFAEREEAETRQVSGHTMTRREKKLRLIWSEVLGVPDVGLDEDFFALGGHSLKVLVITAEIKKTFQVEVSPAELFRARTIRDQSSLIQNGQRTQFLPIKVADEREFYPASAAQKRLYLLQQIDTGSRAYNMPFAFSLRGTVDPDRICEAFQRVIGCYEILRTDFDTINDHVVQQVHRNVNFNVETSEFPENEVEIVDLMRGFVRPFDLSDAPLIRVKVVQIAPLMSFLLLDIHHIVMDGTSMSHLWDELSKAYNGVELAPLSLQYKDYSEWQNHPSTQEALQKQGEYWLEKYRDGAPVLDLPLDFARPDDHSFEGRILRFSLSPEATAKLNQLCDRYDLSLNILLLAAYAILLSKHSGQEDIVIGTPVYGRNHADLKNVIGMFANTLALRFRPNGEKKVSDFLKEAREEMLWALDNQDYPFEDLVERIRLPRDASRNALFDTMVVRQDFEIRGPSWDGLVITTLDPEISTSKFDMTWIASLVNDQIHFQVEYCVALFREERIRDLYSHFRRLLDTICADPSVTLSDLEGSAKQFQQLSHPNKTLNSSQRPGKIGKSRSEIEEILLDIWREVLGIEGVDGDTDFFDAGGHSLKAIGLMLRIRKVFGVDLPNSVVFRHSTVHSMAELLADDPNPDQFTHLVEISKGSGSRRLFCIHATPGTVIYYHDLARHFSDEWSIYGLQAKGLVREQYPHETVEEMASAYVSEIVKIQPEGPYYLLGWSTGGKIGHEVVRQLEATGRVVSKLVMVDTDPVMIPGPFDRFPLTQLLIYTFWTLFTQTRMIFRNWRLMDITSYRPSDFWHRCQVWRNVARATGCHQPMKHGIEAKVVLFQTEACRRRQQKLRDKSRSIATIVENLEIRPISGHHFDLMSSPHIEELCENLREILI